MTKLYGIKDLGEMIGIDPKTVRQWDDDSLIPQSARIGRWRKRVWGKKKALDILTYARDMLGYPIPQRIFDEVRGDNETQTKQ